MDTAGTATKRSYRCVMVNITPGNPNGVDLNEVNVSKRREDEVVWDCEADPNFEVIFDGESPFKQHRFYKGQNHSGPARKDAEEKPYKYTVKAGGETFDPQTIVDP